MCYYNEEIMRAEEARKKVYDAIREFNDRYGSFEIIDGEGYFAYIYVGEDERGITRVYTE